MARRSCGRCRSRTCPATRGWSRSWRSCASLSWRGRCARPGDCGRWDSGMKRPASPHRRRPLFRGRLRPRDLLLGLLIAAGLSGMRLYGLERPLGWYFDEDLHGRTATELLQDWRYGRPHDLEEWTHPHLAKYLMAASIEA